MLTPRHNRGVKDTGNNIDPAPRKRRAHAVRVSTRGPRRDAWYAGLSDDDCWGIYDASREMRWTEIASMLADRFGKAPAKSAWYRFESWMRGRAQAHRVEMAARARLEAQGLAGEAGTASESAKAFLALATEIAMRTGNAEDAEAWTAQASKLFASAQRDTELRLRADAQALNRQKFEAQERRLRAIEDAATERPGEQMSPEERIAKIRAIFGIGGGAQ